MEFLNPYIIRARLFPAVLGVAPAIALLGLNITTDGFAVAQLVATLALGVLFFTFSNIARRFGKSAERRLFASNGGFPTNTFLHRADTRFDNATKDRYRSKLEALCGEKAPTEKAEVKDPAAADAYYKRALTWLRENTRKEHGFEILFEENVTYGFWRNLYGIKWPALILNASVVLICGALLYWHSFSPPAVQSMVTISLIGAVHAAFFVFGVSKRSVFEASDQYARQLVLALDRLQPAPVAKTTA